MRFLWICNEYCNSNSIRYSITQLITIFNQSNMNFIFNLIVDKWRGKKKNKAIHAFFSAMGFHHKRSWENKLIHKQNMGSIYLLIQLYGFWRAVIKFQVLFNAFLTIQFYTDLLLFWFLIVCSIFLHRSVPFVACWFVNWTKNRELNINRNRVWSNSRSTNTRNGEWEWEKNAYWIGFHISPEQLILATLVKCFCLNVQTVITQCLSIKSKWIPKILGYKTQNAKSFPKQQQQPMPLH